MAWMAGLWTVPALVELTPEPGEGEVNLVVKTANPIIKHMLHLEPTSEPMDVTAADPGLTTPTQTRGGGVHNLENLGRGSHDSESI